MGIGGAAITGGDTVEVKFSVASDLKMEGVRDSWGDPGRVTKGVPGGGGVTVTQVTGPGASGVTVTQAPGASGVTRGEEDRARFSPRVELNWGVPRPMSKPSASSTGISRGPVIWTIGGAASNTASSASSVGNSSNFNER